MENIMLNKSQNQIKIVDFGLSNICTRDTPLKTHCGSPKYAAPELFELGKVYGPEIDIWSLGVILFAMLVGRLPFLNSSKEGMPREERTKQLLRKMKMGLNSHHMKLLANFHEDCLKLVRGLLEPNPANRMTMTKVISDPWLTEKMTNPVTLYSYPSIGSKDHSEIVSFICNATNRASSEVETHLNPMKYDSIGGMYSIMSNIRLGEGDRWELMRRGSSRELKRGNAQLDPRRTVSLINSRVELEKRKSREAALWPHNIGVFSKFHDDMVFTSASSSSSVNDQFCSNSDCRLNNRTSLLTRRVSTTFEAKPTLGKVIRNGWMEHSERSNEDDKKVTEAKTSAGNMIEFCQEIKNKPRPVRQYKSFEGLGSYQTSDIKDKPIKSSTPPDESLFRRPSSKNQITTKYSLVRTKNISSLIKDYSVSDNKETTAATQDNQTHDSQCHDDSEETDTSINVIINSEKIIRHVTNLLQQSQALKNEGKEKQAEPSILVLPREQTSPFINSDNYYNSYVPNVPYLTQGPIVPQNLGNEYDNIQNMYYSVSQKKISSSSMTAPNESKNSSDIGNEVIFHKDRHRDKAKYNGGKPMSKIKGGNSKQDNYQNYKDGYSCSRRQSKKNSKSSKSSREKFDEQDNKNGFWRNTNNGNMGVKMVSNKPFGPYCLGNGDYFRELQRDSLRMSALQNQMFVKPYIEQKFLRVFPCHQTLVKPHPKSTVLQLKTISDVRQMVKYT